jgi:hypothetical protein
VAASTSARTEVASAAKTAAASEGAASAAGLGRRR